MGYVCHAGLKKEAVQHAPISHEDTAKDSQVIHYGDSCQELLAYSHMEVHYLNDGEYGE